MTNTGKSEGPGAEISPWLDQMEQKSNLSRSQILIWLGQAVERKAPLYNSAIAWRLTGDLDIDRFTVAFNQLVIDCDALRTVFEERDSIPVQYQLDDVPRELEVADLTDDPGGLDRWLSARVKRRMALERCTYDSALIVLGPNEHVWYLNQHHIVTDFSSWTLLFKRLMHLYECPGSDIPSPPSFAAYVTKERASREEERTRNATEYWRRKVDNRPPQGALYGQLDTGSLATNKREPTILSRELSDSLRALANEPGIGLLNEDVSLFILFATAQLAWLHRASGRRHLTVGVPIHNRSDRNSQEVVGLLMEVFPLSVDIDENETLRSLLGKVGRATMELLGHAVPGVTTPETGKSYDIVLNFVPARMPDSNRFDVECQWIHSGAADRTHKLRMQVHDFDGTGEFHVDFDFNIGTFDEATRKLAARHLLSIIEALPEGLDQEIGSIELLEEDERQRLVNEFNDTSKEYPWDTSVAELFANQARETPDAVAVQEGEETWTYEELEERVNFMARRLIEKGAQPGRVVLICMERSMHAVASMLAAIRSGAAYVPLDVRHPAQRIAAIVDDLSSSDLGRPVAVMTSNSARHLVPGEMDLEFVEDLVPESTEPLGPSTAGDNLAYLIYTSGSTGIPKGVMISQRAMVNYICWARDEYCAAGPTDFALHSSLAVDLTVTSVFVPLLCGGRVVVYPDRGDVDVPILRVFAEDQVDVVKLTPAHLALFRESGGITSRIRTLILGGEDLKRDLVQSITPQFREDLVVYNEYGPTEATVGCMIHRFDPKKDTGVSVPVGQPIANARIYVIDSKGRPAAAGLTGELCIAGVGLAAGYLNNNEKTAQSFVPDPVLANGKMYRSGDVARFTAKGSLAYLGRNDDQVKIRGSRIELGEVEATLASYPGIGDVVANVVRPNQVPAGQCQKCGAPSNYPGIVFNDNGVCSMCLAFDLFEDQARAYFGNMDDFRAIVKSIRSESDSEPHCVALTSGGKDSTYMLYQLVAHGLRPILFTLDNGYVSEFALDNVRRAADDLGLELVIGSTPHMNEIFADSLDRYSNVCHGCFKTIYTLSLNLARERGIKYILTGLSRGQIFETRLDDLFRHRIFDIETIENSILEARKVYHRVDDAVARTLDVQIFSDDSIFREVQFVDFYRYCEVELDEIYQFLETRAPWVRPADTGRSTNCRINDAGIYVHKKERGFHNYALPYSWDVRIGHKTREAALYELDDHLDVEQIQTMLDEIGYHPKASKSEPYLVAYYTAKVDLSADALRAYLSDRVPPEMVPTAFVQLDEMPIGTSGKVDRKRLPPPDQIDVGHAQSYDEPESDIEKRLAALWAEVLEQDEIGRSDNFFDRGGVSLGAIRIMSRVREMFGVELPVQAFFSAPTVAAVAQVIEEMLIADIESMSDEEIERLLEQEAG